MLTVNQLRSLRALPIALPELAVRVQPPAVQHAILDTQPGQRERRASLAIFERQPSQWGERAAAPAPPAS